MGTQNGWQQIYLNTPLLESVPLSELAGFPVYLKLENVQPSGSFKLRGVSNLCQKAVLERGCRHLYTASGGSAGLAASHCAKVLQVPITVVVPRSSPSFIADNLRSLGADVIVHGRVWDEADQYTQKLADQPGCEYIHPFDHPDIWEGHGTMITEAAHQLKGDKPGMVIVSVGGGGLINGVLKGMDKVGWRDVPVLAMETVGADCFNAAVKAGKIVTLPDITSVAKCLGALTVSSTTFDLYYKRKNIHSVVIPDKEAIRACLNFANDHRFLVEPACGASLAAIYSNVFQQLQDAGHLQDVTSALIVVCGGNGVNLQILETWKAQFDL